MIDHLLVNIEKKFSRSDNLAQHLKTHIKTDANGNAMIVYGNPSNHGRKEKKNRFKRKKNSRMFTILILNWLATLLIG